MFLYRYHRSEGVEMKILARLMLSSLGFCVFSIAGVGLMCTTGLILCRIGSDVAVSEAVVPLLVVFGGTFLIGIGVAFLSEQVVAMAKNVSAGRPVLWWVVGGAVIGIVPRLLWEVTTGSFPGTFYPTADYLPFIVGGVASTLIAGSLRKPVNASGA
jgi:hypothetical protein